MTAPCQALMVVPDALIRPVTNEGDEPPDPWFLEQVDRLAKELAAGGLLSVRVIAIGDLAGDPVAHREDTLFLIEDELGAASAIARVLSRPVDAVERRTFALSVRGRRDAIAALERSGGPGCIESRRLFVWQTELPEDDPPGGVFGRKDVALAIGANWDSPALWESEHYAWLSHDAYATLPQLLAAYLVGFCAAVASDADDR